MLLYMQTKLNTNTHISPDQLLITTTQSYVRISIFRYHNTHTNREAHTHSAEEATSLRCIWFDRISVMLHEMQNIDRFLQVQLSSTALWGIISECFPLCLSQCYLLALAPTVFVVGSACHRPGLRNDTQRQGPNLQTLHSFSRSAWINSKMELS